MFYCRTVSGDVGLSIGVNTTFEGTSSVAVISANSEVIARNDVKEMTL